METMYIPAIPEMKTFDLFRLQIFSFIQDCCKAGGLQFSHGHSI